MVKNVKSEAAEFGESVGHGGTKTLQNLEDSAKRTT